MFGCSLKCWCSWFSGLFAAPAIAHGLRLIFEWQFSIGGIEFTWMYSFITFLVFGALSVFCYFCTIKCSK